MLNSFFEGVTFSSNSNNGPLGTLEEMHLVPEPVFVLPTDGVSMTVIQSSSLGRIFMGGKDGCLYEITYQVRIILKFIFNIIWFRFVISNIYT